MSRRKRQRRLIAQLRALPVAGTAYLAVRRRGIAAVELLVTLPAFLLAVHYALRPERTHEWWLPVVATVAVYLIYRIILDPERPRS
jgi:hypothetical protein